MKTTSTDIIKKVQGNMIWLDALRCANPSDEFLRDIGRTVLRMLDKPENLLPTYLDDKAETGTICEKLAERMPSLYLSIHKS